MISSSVMFLLHSPRSLRNSSILNKSTFYCFSTSKTKCESNLSPNQLPVSELLTQKHQISPLVSSRIASSSSALTNLINTQNSDLVVSFLKDYGFSQTQLEKVIGRYPRVLVRSLENDLKPKFKCFKDFGFSHSEIVEIFSKQPWILQASLSNTMLPGLSVLNGLLGSHAQLVNLLMKSGSWLLQNDLEKTLVPNIDYLTSIGVPMDTIHSLLVHYSRFFLLDLEKMKQSVHKAELLGADRNSRMFLYAVKVVGSMGEEAWERKLQALRELGFSEADIVRAFRSAPTLFGVSEEKMKMVKELLLSTGKYSMESIISNPISLMCSVEKRYKPRLHVLEVLDRRRLIKEWPGLATLYQMTDEKFFKTFIAPHMNKSVASPTDWYGL